MMKRMFNSGSCTAPVMCGIFLLVVLHRSGVDYFHVGLNGTFTFCTHFPSFKTRCFILHHFAAFCVYPIIYLCASFIQVHDGVKI